MVLVYSLGMMAGNMKEIILTTKNLDMEYLLGLMVDNMMGTGNSGNKKDPASTITIKVISSTACGPMEKGQNGSKWNSII